MKKRIYINLIIVAISLSLSLGIAEIAVRLYGHFDKDGSFYFQSQRLIPYKMPISIAQNKVNKYLSSSSTYFIYDSILGWYPRPNFSSKNGLYHNDSNGIRVIMPNKGNCLN